MSSVFRGESGQCAGDHGQGQGSRRGSEGHQGAASRGNPGQFRFWQVSIGGILGVIRYAHLLRGFSAWENGPAQGCWYLANARHPLTFQGRA